MPSFTTSANLADALDVYFSDEQNLHRLREKILRLDGYISLSEHEAKLEQERSEHKAANKALQDQHDRACKELRTQYDHDLVKAREELADYQAAVADKLAQAEQDSAALRRWQKDYAAPDSAFANFRALTPQHQKDIAGIFGGCGSPFDFLCGCMQKGHLEQLWDYLSNEMAKTETPSNEGERLSALFDFAFTAVDRSQREPSFRRLTAKKGARFDSDTMTRAFGSPQLGQVKRLVFAGFVHAVTGEVARRSLVELEEL